MTKKSFSKAAVVIKERPQAPQGGGDSRIRLAGWTDADLDAKYGRTGRKMASLYTRAEPRETGAGGGEAHGKSTAKTRALR